MANPYDPPNAKVADPPAVTPALERPKQIRIAIYLLWISLALGTVSFYLDFDSTSDTTQRIIYIVVALIFFPFCMLTNVKISQGRNWARIVFLVLTAISFAFFFLPNEPTHPASMLEFALPVFTFALDATSVYLLFVPPGAEWFKKMRHES